MFENIPFEMRAYNQWICWKYLDKGNGTKPTKVPYDCKTGKYAAVDDRLTWASFAEAVAASKWYDGIGFVLSQFDPYGFIDLDDTHGDEIALNRQMKVYTEFNSYAERSPSGTGLHIIIKGKIPAGRKRSFIEVYSSLRYMTMTGNVYREAPINEHQTLFSLLWEQMGGAATALTYSGNDEQKEPDETIISRARAAVNGAKFEALLQGKWTDLYPSQSEADFAYIDMLAFYTQNRDQITRIFRLSPLGQREKAKRNDYVNYMVNKSFDRMLPPVDIDGLHNQLVLRLAEKEKAGTLSAPASLPLPKSASNFAAQPIAAEPFLPGLAPEVKPDFLATIPAGLLGEIARFIYESAPRGVPEIALATAIGFMSGMCGRAFNVSKTGLNQYTLLLAPTGTGKEAMASGIDKLINAVRTNVAAVTEFIGPAEIASGQALLKYLAGKSPCFVSIIGEFGHFMRQLSAYNANTSQIMLRRVVLDLYAKSGAGQNMRPSIYSDKANNTDNLEAPAFSILGESSPEKFYEALDESMISEGFLPRFTIIEYDGIRPNLNENHGSVLPSFRLIEQLVQLSSQCLTLMHGKKVIDVQLTTDAATASRDFDIFATKQINGTNREVIRHLWNRAHIKVLKLAALLAIGVNTFDPIISLPNIEWAKSLVVHDILRLLKRFELGMIGVQTEETRQQELVRRTVQEFVAGDWHHAERYGVPAQMFQDKVIPQQYISRKLLATAAFRLDRSGATNALKRALQSLLEADTIREIPPSELAKRYGTTRKAYAVSDLMALEAS